MDPFNLAKQNVPTDFRKWTKQQKIAQSGPVWPDVWIKNSSNVPKVNLKSTHRSFYLSNHVFKNYQSFGQLLWKNLLPRGFKNRPIWSHWPRRPARLSLVPTWVPLKRIPLWAPLCDAKWRRPFSSSLHSLSREKKTFFFIKRWWQFFIFSILI